jgi:RNA polymerase sigma factor (sigma-70 family)
MGKPILLMHKLFFHYYFSTAALMISTAIDTERTWLQQLQQNDELALGQLMEKTYTSLYNYAIRFADGDEELVKDAIQEVFISLWQNRATATSILSVQFYLLRAVKNKVLKALYQKRKEASFKAKDEYEFAMEFSIENKIVEQQLLEENSARIKNILAGMSSRQKEIIFLKFYQQLDHGQIAELMSISRQSVYNLLHESLQKIKACWQKEYLVTRVIFMLLATVSLLR